MVVGVDVGVEVREHVLERQRLVDGVEPEGGHAAQGDGRHRSERAEPDARGQQLVAALDVRSDPSASTSSIPATAVERLPSRAPVPCVPVASAPASDCDVDVAEVRQRQAVAVQLAHEPVQGMPASARTSPPARSTSSTRSRRSSDSSVPSVATPPENECPAPATRTARPRATASASSARLPGRTCSAGAHVCPRDQFDHMLRGYRRMSGTGPTATVAA